MRLVRIGLVKERDAVWRAGERKRVHGAALNALALESDGGVVGCDYMRTVHVV